MRPPPDALGVGRRGRSGRGGSVRGGTGRDAVGRGGVGGSGVTARDRRPRSCPAAPPGLLGSAPGPGPDARSCVRALPPGPGRPNSAARPRPACIDRPAPAWWEGRVGAGCPEVGCRRLTEPFDGRTGGRVQGVGRRGHPGGRCLLGPGPAIREGGERLLGAWPGHSGVRGMPAGGLARPFWREGVPAGELARRSGTGGAHERRRSRHGNRRGCRSGHVRGHGAGGRGCEGPQRRVLRWA